MVPSMLEFHRTITALTAALAHVMVQVTRAETIDPVLSVRGVSPVNIVKTSHEVGSLYDFHGSPNDLRISL